VIALKTWFQAGTKSGSFRSRPAESGMFKGFSECVKDLSGAIASMRLKGLCGKFPEYDGLFDWKQRWNILNEILKLRDEDSNQE
jgi:hypothetical protein